MIEKALQGSDMVFVTVRVDGQRIDRVRCIIRREWEAVPEAEQHLLSPQQQRAWAF